MAKRLAGEVRGQKEQIRYLEDYRRSESFADILKAKVAEHFGACRKKMDALYNVG